MTLICRLDTRDIKHFVDQFEEVLSRIVDVTNHFELIGRREFHLQDLAKPSTELSGVRSSWLMRDMNSLLALLARSAASFACFKFISSPPTRYVTRDEYGTSRVPIRVTNQSPLVSMFSIRPSTCCARNR